MTSAEILAGLVSEALKPIFRRAVQPETTFHESGHDIPQGAWHKRNEGFYNNHPLKKPLAPRDRLSTRLALLLALGEARKQLMLDCIRDIEAIEDAKKHNHVPGL